MSRRVWIGCMFLASGLVAGCGMRMGLATEEVRLLTPYADGASCLLTDTSGRSWQVEKTPATVAVARGGAPLTILCRREGFLKGTAVLEKRDFATINSAQGFRADPATVGLLDGEPYYPPVVAVFLEPLKFADSQQKSAWEQARRQWHVAEMEKGTLPGKWRANHMAGVSSGVKPGSRIEQEVLSELMRSRARQSQDR